MHIRKFAMRSTGSARETVRYFWRKVGLPAVCLLLCLCAVGLTVVLSVSAAVKDRTESLVCSLEDADALVGEFDCILVLGCRVYPDGRMSDMLHDRVQVGVSLYEMGLSDTLLMSGDSHTENYDETGAMQAFAMDRGVAEADLLTDPMGLSTYESIARLAEEHPGASVLIVTQEYHLYRSLYIAEKLGLEAYGVSADLRPYSGQFKRDAREVLARCKDVYFSLVQPKVS